MLWIVWRLQEIHHHRMILKQLRKIVEPVQFRREQRGVSVKFSSLLLNCPLRSQAKCDIPSEDNGNRRKQQRAHNTCCQGDPGRRLDFVGALLHETPTMSITDSAY